MVERDLDLKAAAAVIGVGSTTLQLHLAGEHVRSDSARKYENWLAERETSNIFVLAQPSHDVEPEEATEDLPPPPARPRLVVDVFSGCGGLSLGFDLLGDGAHFRTILALDIQPKPIATLNRNAALLGRGDYPVGQTTDLTQFMNEAEFLAFYLQHVGGALNNSAIHTRLFGLRNGAFPEFLDAVADADRLFLDELRAIRSMPAWREELEALDQRALDQTSVIGFHEKLALPRPSRKVAGLPRLLWGEASSDPGEARPKKWKPDTTFLEVAQWEWDEEARTLAAKQEAEGEGQLIVSPRRVGGFVRFLNTESMRSVRKSWMVWHARRLQLRSELFADESFAEAVRTLYTETAQVSVLVGGPPCQGFSRIGRGKIRSLRDARVHVHGNAEAGDSRNLLFQQYVMVLGALRPDVFVFENVQHFESVVKVDGGEFQATDILAEAIANVSDGEANYEVASDILDASRFGIPQTRLRYFMVGVLARPGAASASMEALGCLALRRDREAPMALALAGLPAPAVVGGEIKGGDAMASLAMIDDSVLGDHPFVQWIRRPRPGATTAPAAVDAHASRAARADDAAFFSLMGPGKRWMDYRADAAPTIGELANLIDALLALPVSIYEVLASTQRKGLLLPDRDALKALRNRVDGALSLRLLLEHTGEKLGESHHLLGGNYMDKREGNHGDWVARMDASRPAKTMVSHMGKDTYAYIHPYAPRTISVREAARIQSFPDWFSFGSAALTDAFRMVGNAVPPMLSHAIAGKVAHVLSRREADRGAGRLKA
ncbi:DNA cytosine methyltransferase [Xanthobacter autotrophicus DSM 431]|uniref:DNA cytosine methyltransferase n=1 Tax=Xanthobacter nonsaccharivorans TaxID=3119912 RepID=UPI00372C81CD